MSLSSNNGAALSGIRVIDLTTVIFGPYATQTLADYGADVIKIEAPEGDGTRLNGPAQEPDMGSLFLGVNRNKRSVVLDLKQGAAQDALAALTDTADVFIHNVRPQKLARLGLGADVLRARNPRLIFVGLHGFGEGGPYAGKPAYDDIIQALSGATDLVARKSGQADYFPTVVADKIAGQMAVHAVMAALFQRERTGQGQVVEVPMFECMTSFLLVEHFYARHLKRQEEPAKAAEMGYPRSIDPSRRPYATADGSACVMPYTDQNWRDFFHAVNRPDLAMDLRFATAQERHRHIGELLPLMGEIVRQRTTQNWLDTCEALQIPCAPINRLQDLEKDAHLTAVDFFQTVRTPDSDYRFPRSPVRLSASSQPMSAPPHLGEHTCEILSELSLHPDKLAQLTGLQSGSSGT